MDSRKIELYHGSGQIVEFPEIRKTRYTKDFSWGFYLLWTRRPSRSYAKAGMNRPAGVKTAHSCGHTSS